MMLARRGEKKMNFSNLCLYYLFYGFFFFLLLSVERLLKSTNEKESTEKKSVIENSVVEKREKLRTGSARSLSRTCLLHSVILAARS